MQEVIPFSPTTEEERRIGELKRTRETGGPKEGLAKKKRTKITEEEAPTIERGGRKKYRMFFIAKSKQVAESYEKRRHNDRSNKPFIVELVSEKNGLMTVKSMTFK